MVTRMKTMTLIVTQEATIPVLTVSAPTLAILTQCHQSQVCPQEPWLGSHLQVSVSWPQDPPTPPAWPRGRGQCLWPSPWPWWTTSSPTGPWTAWTGLRSWSRCWLLPLIWPRLVLSLNLSWSTRKLRCLIISRETTLESLKSVHLSQNKW